MDLPAEPPEAGDEVSAALQQLQEALDAQDVVEETHSLHFRAAQICLGLPGGLARKRALRHLRASWEARPGDQDTLLVLATCLQGAEHEEQLAELYAEAGRHADQPDERALLLLRAASAFSALGLEDRAMALYEQVLTLKGDELRPQRARAARTMAELLQQARRPEQEAKALSLLMPDLDGRDSFVCALRIATLQREAGQDDDAYTSYRLALSLRPGAREALDPAQDYLRRHQRFDELADLLTTAAANAPTSGERAAFWREVASVSEGALSDLERAASAWWRAWENAAQGEEPANLKRLYTEQEQWSSYLTVLQKEALRAADASHKVDVYHELATLLREVLEDDVEAAATYRLILQLRPDDLDALGARVEILEARGEVDEAGRALQRGARFATSPQQRDQLLRRLSRLEFARDRHEPLLRALRQLAPTEEENRALVTELHRGCADKDDGGAQLRRKLDALLLTMGADDDLLLEIAARYAADGDQGEAADLYRQLLDRKPDHGQAKAALEELERALDPRQTPAEALARQAEAHAETHPRQAIQLLARAAQVAAHGDVDDQAKPREFLERALSLCGPEVEIGDLHALETSLRQAKMHRELAGLLAESARHAEDNDRRRELLRARADLLRDELDEPQQAVEVLAEALALDPADTPLAREVIDLHRQLGNYQALADTLERLVVWDEGNLELLEELGLLYAEHLDDQTGGLRHFEALLELSPAHPKALAYCRAYDEENGDYRSVAVRLSRAVEVMVDVAERAELHREIAQIAEQHLSDLDFAIAHWRKVVETFPGDAAPRSELKRLLTLAAHYEDVEAVLLSDVSRSIPEQKVPVYMELAQLAASKLRNQRAAAAYLRNALQLAPENREVMTRLEALYEQGRQWRELSVILRRHADAEKVLDDQVRLLLRAARVLLVHLGREEEALAVCRRVRELRPGERHSAELMREIYTKRQQWRQLVALMRDQIGQEADSTELGRLHLDMGRLMLEKIQDPEAAATHFELALDLDAGGEVLPLLRKIYATMGRWDLLTELIRRRASAEDLSPADRADALCEIGRIREEQQSDLEAAAEAYESAIHLAPDHRPALSALRALSIVGNQWRDAVTLARRELELTEAPPERARMLVEIADILLHQLVRPSAAAEALEQALEDDPNNGSAVEQLAAIYFEDQSWEKAGRFLEQVVNSGVELSDIHVYFYRLGYACEQLGQGEEAFGYYVKSFGREPLYLPTLNRLVELCYQRRQWDNTLRITEAIIDTYADDKTPEQQADLYVRYGLCKLHLAQRDVAMQQLQKMVLGRDHLPQTEKSAWEDVAETWAATPLEPTLLRRIDAEVATQVIKAMEQALTRVANHPGALQILSALTICRNDWDRALRYLERAADSPQLERMPQALLLVCAADIAAWRLQALQRAEGYYRRALSVLPASRVARTRLERLRAPATPRSRPRAATQPPEPGSSPRTAPPPAPTSRPPRPSAPLTRVPSVPVTASPLPPLQPRAGPPRDPGAPATQERPVAQGPQSLQPRAGPPRDPGAPATQERPVAQGPQSLQPRAGPPRDPGAPATQERPVAQGPQSLQPRAGPPRDPEAPATRERPVARGPQLPTDKPPAPPDGTVEPPTPPTPSADPPPTAPPAPGAVLAGPPAPPPAPGAVSAAPAPPASPPAPPTPDADPPPAPASVLQGAPASQAPGASPPATPTGTPPSGSKPVSGDKPAAPPTPPTPTPPPPRRRKVSAPPSLPKPLGKKPPR